MQKILSVNEECAWDYTYSANPIVYPIQIPGVKILCLLHLHYNVAFTFK